MPTIDVVTDTLQRLAERRKIPKAILKAVEQDIRKDWGGDRVYIKIHGDDAADRLSERDARIRRDHHRGERVPLLAIRYGICEKRVRQILQCGGDFPTHSSEKER